MNIRDGPAGGKPLMSDRAMGPYTGGRRLMTPFRRTALVTRIVEAPR